MQKQVLNIETAPLKLTEPYRGSAEDLL